MENAHTVINNSETIKGKMVPWDGDPGIKLILLIRIALAWLNQSLQQKDNSKRIASQFMTTDKGLNQRLAGNDPLEAAWPSS